MITIYITRHGQTYFNIEKRLQGQTDSELTDEGILGAELLCERFKEIDIDYIITSPLKRTKRTSEIIKGNKDIPIITNDDLMEVNIGDFSGKTVEEMRKINPSLVEAILDDPYAVAYPKGENLVEFYDRSAKAINDIIRDFDGKSVLVVSHGGVLKCIEHYFRDEMVPPNWADEVVTNCSLTKYEIDGNSIKEVFFDDTKHLAHADAFN